MRRIRVICGGCGIEQTNEHGHIIHMLKTRESGPFDCQEEAAARLVALGVAEFVGEKEEKGKSNEDMEEDEQPQDNSVREGQFRSMKIKDLNLLARNRGLDTSGCVKKEDYIVLLTESVQDEETGEDEEELPILGGADPV